MKWLRRLLCPHKEWSQERNVRWCDACGKSERVYRRSNDD